MSRAQLSTTASALPRPPRSSAERARAAWRRQHPEEQQNHLLGIEFETQLPLIPSFTPTPSSRTGCAGRYCSRRGPQLAQPAGRLGSRGLLGHAQLGLLRHVRRLCMHRSGGLRAADWMVWHRWRCALLLGRSRQARAAFNRGLESATRRGYCGARGLFGPAAFGRVGKFCFCGAST